MWSLQNINNEVVTNHYDVVSNISNSSNEEEDEPPPLPPPRGESLTRSMMADLTSNPITRNGKHVIVKVNNFQNIIFFLSNIRRIKCTT